MDQKKGDKLFKKGKENITLSIFNWSKDYAMAASNFQEALKAYKAAGCVDKCLDTLRELIVCNEKNKDEWGMARNHEAIVQIYLKNFPNIQTEKLKQQATEAFVHFRMAQSLDKGLGLISKVTKFLIQRKQMKQGVDLLHEAYKIAVEQEKSFKKQQIFNQIIEAYFQTGLYIEAEGLYKEEIQMKKGQDCEQLGLIVLLLILIQGQPKRAQKQMYELSNIIPNFLSTTQCQAADNLIRAYLKGQAQQFKKLTTKAAITTLFPVIIIRKVRQITVPSGAQFQNADTDKKQKMIEDVLF